MRFVETLSKQNESSAGAANSLFGGSIDRLEDQARMWEKELGFVGVRGPSRFGRAFKNENSGSQRRVHASQALQRRTRDFAAL